jgi:hypothetical protein
MMKALENSGMFLVVGIVWLACLWVCSIVASFAFAVTAHVIRNLK